MDIRLKILAVLSVILFSPYRSHAQTAQGYKFATESQVKFCAETGSSIVKAQCDNLAFEFNKKKSAQTQLQGSLLDPFVDLTPFIVAIRNKAFEREAAAKVESDLSQVGLTALNAAAQVVSTKAAVTQNGAAASASGATNLVTKPTTTDLISLAAESGAFTDTVNGNSLTAQANVDGVRRYLTGQPFADLSPTALDVLDHINLTATFTIAQSGSTGVSTSGTATASTPSIATIILPSNNVSFNSLSASFTLYRHYNPHSSAFASAWKDALEAKAGSLASATHGVEAAVLKLTPFREKAYEDANLNAAQETWRANAKMDETNEDFSKFVNDYRAFVEAFEATIERLGGDNFYTDILSVNSALQTLREVNESVLDAARGTPLLTLSYTYSTPQDKPATHTATLAAAYVFRKWNGAQVTVNGAGSWFASVPMGAKYGRVQSYQFSGEYEQPIGPNKTAPRATFSVAGYAQYQYIPTVLNITSGNLAPGTNIMLPNNAQVLLGTAGWLEVAQAKLVFNLNKGLSIPVAFKWSNKTDLLPSINWKGQFGITYDLSALSSLLSAKN